MRWSIGKNVICAKKILLVCSAAFHPFCCVFEGGQPKFGEFAMVF
jgi:hypothetical protein